MRICDLIVGSFFSCAITTNLYGDCSSVKIIINIM